MPRHPSLPLKLLAGLSLAAPLLSGCLVGTAVGAAGAVVGTGVKAGARVTGAAVGVAADGMGAAGRAVTGSRSGSGGKTDR